MQEDKLNYFTKKDFPGADEVSLEKGSFILMEGDASGIGVYLLLEGEVEVFVDDVTGGETLMFTLEPGHLVGELGVLGVEKRLACVRCLTPARLLHIPGQIWKQRMQDTVFVRKVLHALVERFAATQDVVRRLSQSQAVHRLGIYLLDRNEWYGVEGDTVTVELPTHVNLARMLNCTREHITKIMKRFTKAGAIVANGDVRMVTLSKDRISSILTLK